MTADAGLPRCRTADSTGLRVALQSICIDLDSVCVGQCVGVYPRMPDAPIQPLTSDIHYPVRSLAFKNTSCSVTRHGIWKTPSNPFKIEPSYLGDIPTVIWVRDVAIPLPIALHAHFIIWNYAGFFASPPTSLCFSRVPRWRAIDFMG